jgi:hypothetical protein
MHCGSAPSNTVESDESSEVEDEEMIRERERRLRMEQDDDLIRVGGPVLLCAGCGLANAWV